MKNTYKVEHYNDYDSDNTPYISICKAKNIDKVVKSYTDCMRSSDHYVKYNAACDIATIKMVKTSEMYIISLATIAVIKDNDHMAFQDIFQVDENFEVLTLTEIKNSASYIATESDDTSARYTLDNKIVPTLATYLDQAAGIISALLDDTDHPDFDKRFEFLKSIGYASL
jgi:hypothetical protein